MWYFDHSADDKGKTVLENMLQEEKKHFPSGSAVPNPSAVVSAPVSISKVSPIWTGDDVNSLQKGIVSYLALSPYIICICTQSYFYPILVTIFNNFTLFH